VEVIAERDSEENHEIARTLSRTHFFATVCYEIPLEFLSLLGMKF